MSYFKTKVLAVLAALFIIVPAVAGGGHTKGKEYIVYYYAFNPNNDAKQANRFEPVFEPEFIKAEVGDTIRFVPKEPRHNSVSISGLIPQGATPWTSELDTEFTISLDTEGVYAYKCEPHYEMGHVGVIQVGDGFVNKAEFTKNAAKINHEGGEKIRRLVAENVK